MSYLKKPVGIIERLTDIWQRLWDVKVTSGTVTTDITGQTIKAHLLDASTIEVSWADTVNQALRVNVVAGVAAAEGSIAQLQIRDAANIWTDVGYYTGNLFVPVDLRTDNIGLLKPGQTIVVTATDLDIRQIIETIPVSRTWTITETIPVSRTWTITETIPVTATTLDIRQITETIPVSRTWTITETVPTNIITTPFLGTPYRYYGTVNSTIIPVAAGESVRIFGYLIVAEDYEVVKLRYTDDKLIAICPTKGAIGLNLANINESNTVSVYLDKSGTGYVLAVVYAEVS